MTKSTRTTMSPSDRLEAARSTLAAASAEQRRSALVFAGEHGVDPTSAATKEARSATEKARASLAAAEQEVRDASAAVEHEGAMLALADEARTEDARAAKVAELDALVATLAPSVIEAELKPMLPELVATYRAAAGLVSRVDQVLAARAERRMKARALVHALGIQPQIGDRLYAVVSDHHDRPVSTARNFFASTLSTYLAAHPDLVRTAGAILAVAPPEAA